MNQILMKLYTVVVYDLRICMQKNKSKNKVCNVLFNFSDNVYSWLQTIGAVLSVPIRVSYLKPIYRNCKWNMMPSFSELLTIYMNLKGMLRCYTHVIGCVIGRKQELYTCYRMCYGRKTVFNQKKCFYLDCGIKISCFRWLVESFGGQIA